MQKNHKLTQSARKYPRGLRIFECDTCEYAFAAEVNEHDVIQYETKVTINYGDLDAAHALFHIPEDQLTLNIGSSTDIASDFDDEY